MTCLDLPPQCSEINFLVGFPAHFNGLLHNLDVHVYVVRGEPELKEYYSI